MVAETNETDPLSFPAKNSLLWRHCHSINLQHFYVVTIYCNVGSQIFCHYIIEKKSCIETMLQLRLYNIPTTLSQKIVKPLTDVASKWPCLVTICSLQGVVSNSWKVLQLLQCVSSPVLAMVYLQGFICNGLLAMLILIQWEYF